jgi:hypothetical protein
MSRNGYLSSVTHVAQPLDLAHATVEGISIDEFEFNLVHTDGPDGGRTALAISSPTRHHTLDPQRLAGSETMVEILKLALAMARVALMEDAAYRFKFHGSPIFARGVE